MRETTKHRLVGLTVIVLVTLAVLTKLQRMRDHALAGTQMNEAKESSEPSPAPLP